MSDYATVPSLPRTRRSARLQAVEAEPQVQNQIIGSNVNLDRLTILPPEILIMIWERLFIPHEPDTTTCPNQFIPLHSRLLHVQRANLYRHVVLNGSVNVSRFAASLEGNETLGGLVKTFTIYTPAEESGVSSLSAALESITLRLCQCTSLEAPPTVSALLYQIDTPHGSFLSQLVHLTVTFFTHDPSCYSRLIALSPHLCTLQITDINMKSAVPVPGFSIAPTIQPSKSYHRLKVLSIALAGDFRHPDIQHLLSSVSARDVTLRGTGVNAGLKALRNPSATVHIRANELVRDGSPSFDSALLRFKKLTVLEVCGDVNVTEEFYMSLAQACPNLRRFVAHIKFKLDARALIKAIPHLPSSFKRLQLYHVAIRKNGYTYAQRTNWFPALWPVGCTPLDMTCLIQEAKKRGIRVEGYAVDALHFGIEREREIEEAELACEGLGDF